MVTINSIYVSFSKRYISLPLLIHVKQIKGQVHNLTFNDMVG